MVQRCESQSNKDEMTDSPPHDLDRRDWAARASEALAQAEVATRCDAKPSEAPRSFASQQTGRNG